MLHGWNSGIEKHSNDQEVQEMFGKFGGITPQYVLAKNSHCATAVYPAIKHAMVSILIGVNHSTNDILNVEMSDRVARGASATGKASLTKL